MERNEIKRILNENARKEKGEKAFNALVPVRKRARRIRRTLTETAKKYYGTLTENDDLVWLCDNCRFVCGVLRALERERKAVYAFVLSECKKLLEICSNSLDENALSALFESLKEKGADDSAFRCVRDTLLFAICGELPGAVSAGNKPVGKLICSMRFVGEYDFSRLISDNSELEKILRSEPGNVYSRSDKQTQTKLRERVENMARKEKSDARVFLSGLLKRAEKDDLSVFELTKKKSKGGLFLLFRTALFILFAAGFAAFSALSVSPAVSVLCSVLLLPGAWCCAGELSIFAAQAFAEAEALPRLRLDRCPEDSAVCVALTCMVSDVTEAYALCERLEDLFLSQFPSKKRDPNVFFGIIGDLFPAKTAKTDGDEAVRRQLADRVECLNLKYGGGFFVYLRPRVFNEGENSYIGRERKRGAICDFAQDCFSDPKTEKLFGDRGALVKAKLLVTLDRDTQIGFRQLYRLIGAALHPHNRPVVELIDGVPVVTKGHGVLQPRIVSKVGAETTPLSVLLCGAGGNEPYSSAAFDVYQDLFGCGMFCGKGVVDLEAYRKVCSGAFENSLILSHDIPEGARLRCGHLDDQSFSECVPDSTISLSSRKHRWIRGDVQSLSCASKRVRDASGRKVKNPVEKVYRFVLVDNVIRDLLPVFAFVLIFAGAFLPGSTAWRLAFAATLYILLPPIFYFLTRLVSGGLKSASVSFYSKVLSGTWTSFLSFLIALCSLATDALNAADAAFRSVWRMKISKKHLLEWKTFSSLSGPGTFMGHVYANLFSLAVGALLLIFSPNRPSRLFGLLWTLYPPVSFLISRPYEKKRGLSEKNRKVLKEYLRDSYLFFSEHSGPENAFLIPDNVSVSPLESETGLCSPTNAGLYLVSLAAARELGFIDTPEMASKLKKALSTLEKLEKFNGHLYNWYDLGDLKPAGNRYVSTVDSGNFTACLVCLVNVLKTRRSEDARISSLITGFEKIARDMRFDFLFDRSKNLFFVGFDAGRGEPDGHHYDLYMSEARMTSFLCVAKGLVPSGHWSALGRVLIKNRNHIGAASWTGTAFEYFMSALFMPVFSDSFESEALDFAFHAQKSFCWGEKKVFGVSESGFFEFDNSMNYQYKAMGAPLLRLKRETDDTLVISPYSSFIMMRQAPNTLMRNLNNLKKLGLYGKYGFYEALDCSKKRTGGCAAVKSYMAHHLGMSLIAGANMLLDDLFVRRFCADENVRASLSLLEEKIPVDARVPKGRVETKERKIPQRPRESKEKKHVAQERFFLYAGSGTGFVTSSRGACQIALMTGKGPIVFSRPFGVDEKGGLIVRVRFSGIILSSLKRENPDGAVYSFYDCLNYCQTVVRYKKTLVRFTFAPSAGEREAIGVRIEVKGAVGTLSAEAECFPALCDKRSYSAHPAFSDLFCEYYCEDGGTLVIRRRGSLNSGSVCAALSFSKDAEVTYCCGEPQDFRLEKPLAALSSSGQKYPLLYPAVRLIQKKRIPYTERSAGFSFAITIGTDEQKTTAVCARVCRSLGERSSFASFLSEGVNLAGSFYAPDIRDLEDAVLKKWLFKDVPGFTHENCGADLGALWSLGISADVPVVTVLSKDYPPGIIKQLILRKKFHHLCGIEWDLVLPVECDGYRREDLDEISRFIYEGKAGFLLGKKGGIHPVSRDEETPGLLSGASDVYASSCVRSIRTQRLRVRQVLNDEKTDGRFTDGGFEILSRSDLYPKWCHVLASECAGCVVTDRSLGFTWFSNASQKKLTYWNNDRFSERGEETVLFSPDRLNYTDLVASSQRVSYRAGFAVYYGKSDGADYEISVCVHPRLHFKLIRCRMKVFSKCVFDLGFRFTPALGENSFLHGNVNALLRKDTVEFSVIPHGIRSVSRGFALCTGGDEECELKLLNDSSVFLSKDVSVNSPRTVTVYFALGAYSSDAYLDAVKASVSDGVFDLARRYCIETLPGGSDGRGIFPFWLSYQTVFSRFIARTGFSQCGGAFGFRDQLQDVLVFLPERPRFVKLHLLRCACHQFKEGDALHWWHNVGQGTHRGIRTKISDDYLWFPLVLALYVGATSDRSVLELEAPYLEGDPLRAEERDRFDSFGFSREKESLEDHARRAIALYFDRGFGAHFLPYMGTGDWNDGMDLVGKKGGESVWLCMFALIVIRVFDDTVGLGEKLKSRFDKLSKRLIGAVEDSFNGKWFIRAYYADGVPLGDGSDPEAECGIDLLPQSFYVLFQQVFYGGKDPVALLKAKTAVRNASEFLFDKDKGVLRLFAPSFTRQSPDPGYISSYSAGLRENGGQYTHAAVWFCFALYYLSQCEDGEEFSRLLEKALDAVDPQRICRVKERMEIYRNEPYVLSGDVYYAPGKEGRGGWSWYTGSAGWLYALYKLIRQNLSAPGERPGADKKNGTISDQIRDF